MLLIFNLFPIQANYDGYSGNLQLQLVSLIPHLLEMSSILHVTLLVYLRLFAIIKPMSYKSHHIKLRYNSIFVIWSMSFFVHNNLPLNTIRDNIETQLPTCFCWLVGHPINKPKLLIKRKKVLF